MRLLKSISALVSGRPVPESHRPSPVEVSVTTGAHGRLHIPAPDPTAEDRLRDQWREHGLRLARQEDWDTLSAELKRADTDRDLTPGGMSIAELIAFGARADAVSAVEHALMEGVPETDAPLLLGVEALESVLAEHRGDYAIALIVAQTHMDIAWSWRGNGLDAQVPDLNMRAFEAHMDRAAAILDPFLSNKTEAPALLAAGCALTRGVQRSETDLARSYETLIDLNPLDTRHMRALGTALLPRWYGSYDRLELEARRTAARLSDIWGAGGYTWVMLDVIAHDPQACARVDLDYFIDGLRDILTRRPDQFTSNLIAAYCSVTMSGDIGLDAADFNRARIHGCRDWIICDHMTELHPLLWAHATRGFDNALRIRSLDSFAERGMSEAQRVLKALFSPVLAKGQDVTFTREGPVTETV